MNTGDRHNSVGAEGTSAVRTGSDGVEIARCPEHGLHGERTSCFVCGGEVEQVRMVLASELAVAVRERDIMRKANVTHDDAQRPLGQSVEYWQDKALDWAGSSDHWRVRAINAEAAADPEQKALRGLITSMMGEHTGTPGSYENEYSDGWQSALDQIEDWLDARAPGGSDPSRTGSSTDANGDVS